MKYLLVILLFVITLAISAQAQTVTTTETTPQVVTIVTTPMVTTTVQTPMTIKTPMAVGGVFTLSPSKVIKDAPFSAEGISESVQVLEDGNRIKRSFTTKMYRDSDGRSRREGAGSTGGSGYSYSTYGGIAAISGFSQTIAIFDPVENVTFILNPTNKTARRYTIATKLLPGEAPLTVIGSTLMPGIPSQLPTDASKKQIEQNVIVTTNVVVKPGIAIASGNGSGIGSGMSVGGGKTESLGTKMIEGVEAEGTRTVTTIEAGKIGNERPIEITYEKWFSKELDLIVYSRHYDPRFGEQTYKLVNIDRSNPDRSLFTVPSDYKINTESTTKSYTYTTTAPVTPTPKQQ